MNKDLEFAIKVVKEVEEYYGILTKKELRVVAFASKVAKRLTLKEPKEALK